MFIVKIYLCEKNCFGDYFVVINVFSYFCVVCRNYKI